MEKTKHLVRISNPYNLKRCRNCGKHLAPHFSPNGDCKFYDSFFKNAICKNGSYYLPKKYYKLLNNLLNNIINK